MISLVQKANNAFKFTQAWRGNTGYKLDRLDIAVSAKCNARCVMCNIWKLDGKNGQAAQAQLTFQELETMLTDAAVLGLSSIALSGGEPLLRPDLTKIIAMAGSLGITSTVFTNGLLLSKEKADELVRSGLSGLVLSIDAPEPKAHDSIRGVAGLWSRATKGIKCMQESKNALGIQTPKIHIHTLVTRQALHHLHQMPALAQELGAESVVYLPLINKTENAAVEYGLRAADIKKITDLPGVVQPGYYERHLCLEPWFKMTVDPYGEIYPCCFAMPFQNSGSGPDQTFWGADDQFSLGNIRSQSINHIWNGEAMRDFRSRLHGPPPFAMCAWCNYKPRQPFCRLEPVLKNLGNKQAVS